jgi:hypothetical protein
VDAWLGVCALAGLAVAAANANASAARTGAVRHRVSGWKRIVFSQKKDLT